MVRVTLQLAKLLRSNNVLAASTVGVTHSMSTVPKYRSTRVHGVNGAGMLVQLDLASIGCE